MFLIKTTLNHQLFLWSYRFEWLKNFLTLNRLKHFLAALLVVCAASVVLQFLYPSSLAMPQARISGKYVGFSKAKTIESQANSLNSQALTMKLQGNALSTPLKEIGLTIDGQKTAQMATNYNWRNRLIPFSLLFSRRNIDNYPLLFDEAKITPFVQSLAKYDQAPTEAKVKIEGVNVTTEASKSGFAYKLEDTIANLKDLEIDNSLEVSLFPLEISPVINTQAAEQATTKIKDRLSLPFVISAAGKTLNIDSQTLASWVVTVPDAKTKTLNVTYDRAKIKAKLQTLSSQVYIADTPNRVSMLDGEVGSETGGASGLALQMEASIDEVIAAATNGATLVLAKTQPVTPDTQIIRSYTRSSKGLQALVNYWVRSHGGQFGIVLKTVDGQITASHNADKRFTSASIYKLYVSYVVYTRIAAGQMSLDDSTSTGYSVSGCIDLMIVRSDNACAIALGNMVGWESNDPTLHAKGYGSTTLNSGSHLTTANDAATLVSQLQADTFVRSDLNAMLISLMKRQIFRTGIPAGSKGEVADKVGFLDGLYHDAAIVYHPKGTYVLVVMSSGSSFSTIADLARQISNVMDQ